MKNLNPIKKKARDFNGRVKKDHYGTLKIISQKSNQNMEIEASPYLFILLFGVAKFMKESSRGVF